jgi:hypothetical protein
MIAMKAGTTISFETLIFVAIANINLSNVRVKIAYINH